MLPSFFSSSALVVPLAVGCDCCCMTCIERDSSSSIDSLKNLTVTSISGVAPPPVPGTPAPCCPFRSPSSLNRFQDGGDLTSCYKIAFTKHIFPVFTSPRARSRGSVALPVGREAGMEEPMEGEAKRGELETVVTPAP